jgi:diamine N-acetyltransferase
MLKRVQHDEMRRLHSPHCEPWFAAALAASSSFCWVTIMSAVIYRLGEPGDALAIAAQGQAAFLEAFQHVYAAHEIEGYFAKTYGPGMQDQELGDPECRLFLVEDELGLAGHLKLGRCTLPRTEGEPSAEIKRFYVLTRAQGAGIARALLLQAIEAAQAQGVRGLYLSCWKGNDRALHFYQRKGFTIVGEQQFSVGTRIDEDYIMRRLI